MLLAVLLTPNYQEMIMMFDDDEDDDVTIFKIANICVILTNTNISSLFSC